MMNNLQLAEKFDDEGQGITLRAVLEIWCLASSECCVPQRLWKSPQPLSVTIPSYEGFLRSLGSPSNKSDEYLDEVSKRFTKAVNGHIFKGFKLKSALLSVPIKSRSEIRIHIHCNGEAQPFGRVPLPPNSLSNDQEIEKVARRTAFALVGNLFMGPSTCNFC